MTPMVFVRSQDLLSKANPTSRRQRILQFPLSRLVLAVLFLIPAAVFRNMAHHFGRQYLSDSTFDWMADGFLVLSSLLLIASYQLYTRVIERRPAHEFSTTQAAPEFGIGVLVGALPIIIIVGVIHLFNGYAIESLNGASSLVHMGRTFMWSGLLEEILFKLIVFRLLEEWLGSFRAVVIAAILFGLNHVFNPGATIWTTFCLTLLSLPELAAFLATRRIWLAWGSHFSWNFFQTAVFGMATSGVSGHSTLIVPSITGPDWLTGGSFGLEATLLGVALPMVAVWLLWRVALRRGQIVQPSWVRDRNRETVQ